MPSHCESAGKGGPTCYVGGMIHINCRFERVPYSARRQRCVCQVVTSHTSAQNNDKRCRCPRHSILEGVAHSTWHVVAVCLEMTQNLNKSRKVPQNDLNCVIRLDWVVSKNDICSEVRLADSSSAPMWTQSDQYVPFLAWNVAIDG
jgi:hypothetical protein